MAPAGPHDRRHVPRYDGQVRLGQFPVAEESGDLLPGPGLPVGGAAVVDALGGCSKRLIVLAGGMGQDEIAARCRSIAETPNANANEELEN